MLLGLRRFPFLPLDQTINKCRMFCLPFEAVRIQFIACGRAGTIEGNHLSSFSGLTEEPAKEQCLEDGKNARERCEVH